jgi:hypothetical protein
MTCAPLFLIAAAAVDPALLRLAAPNATVVAGMRVAEVRDTAIGKFVLGQFAGSGREFENFVAATGFDPRKDIEELVFSAAGEGWLVAARGVFPPETLTKLARSAGADLTVVEGIEVVDASRAAAASPIGRPMSFAFLSRTTVLAGDYESVRAAVLRRRAARGPALARQAAAAAARYPAWFAASEIAAATAGSAPLSGEMLKGVQMATGGLEPGDPMRFHAELVERTPEGANSLAEVLRFMTQIALAQSDAEAESIAGSLRAAQVVVEGTVVRLAMPVTPEVLEALLTPE